MENWLEDEDFNNMNQNRILQDNYLWENKPQFESEYANPVRIRKPVPINEMNRSASKQQGRSHTVKSFIEYLIWFQESESFNQPFQRGQLENLKVLIDQSQDSQVNITINLYNQLGEADGELQALKQFADEYNFQNKKNNFVKLRGPSSKAKSKEFNFFYKHSKNIVPNKLNVLPSQSATLACKQFKVVCLNLKKLWTKKTSSIKGVFKKIHKAKNLSNETLFEIEYDFG